MVLGRCGHQCSGHSIFCPEGSLPLRVDPRAAHGILIPWLHNLQSFLLELLWQSANGCKLANVCSLE